MKKKLNSQKALVDSRVAIALIVCLTVVLVALGGTIPGTHAVPGKPASSNQTAIGQAQLPTLANGPSSVRSRSDIPATAPSGLPTVSSRAAGVHAIGFRPTPRFPAVVLYDQLDNPGTVSTGSQEFETANAAFDDFTADDFVVPGGETWNITEVDAQGVYFNGAGPAKIYALRVHFGNIPSLASGHNEIVGGKVIKGGVCRLELLRPSADRPRVV